MAEGDAAAIGVDIGGTHIRVGLAQGGRLLRTVSAPTPHDDADAVVTVLCDLVAELTSPPGTPIGIAVAAYLDRDREVVRYAPNLPLRDEPWGEILAERLGVPVMLENDANAAGWGEYRFGAGQGARSMVMVTVGTGIGGAIIIDGVLVVGHHGTGAEMGHMQVVNDETARRCGCGCVGCWEVYGSGTAVETDARELVAGGGGRTLLAAAGGDQAAITGTMIARMALEGDDDAGMLVEGAARWLGRGIASVGALLDPERIVVGGGVADAGELVMAPLVATYRDITTRGHRECASVSRASLGNDAGLLGAADLAYRHRTKARDAHPGP